MCLCVCVQERVHACEHAPQHLSVCANVFSMCVRECSCKLRVYIDCVWLEELSPDTGIPVFGLRICLILESLKPSWTLVLQPWMHRSAPPARPLAQPTRDLEPTTCRRPIQRPTAPLHRASLQMRTRRTLAPSCPRAVSCTGCRWTKALARQPDQGLELERPDGYAAQTLQEDPNEYPPPSPTPSRTHTHTHIPFP